MRENIEERVLKLGNYIVESGATVRQTAKCFGVSKSTVHKDVTERLPELNRVTAALVRDILDNNKSERHLRGGEATRQKYRTLRLKQEQPRHSQ